jgi:hypothetical protein
MSELPRIVCLCPTFRRPSRLVENSIACYLAQTYPADRRRLLILDDANDLAPQTGDGWEVVSQPIRIPSLPEKYHQLIMMADERWQPDAYCIWEDDDIYFPWHLEAHVHSLASRPWSHPSHVWALTTGEMVKEPAMGHLHASLAFTRDAYQRTGGWPLTNRADFDLQLLSILRRTLGPPGNPLNFDDCPSYVFRWGSTQHPHGQNFMRSPQDEEWYTRALAIPPIEGPPRHLIPSFDQETVKVLQETGHAPSQFHLQDKPDLSRLPI